MALGADASESLEFGPFRLFPVRRLLERDGRPVPLGTRALDMLLVLATRAPEVVGKYELMDRVWPGVTVQEDSLRFQMLVLRKALGDGVEGQRYISTVQGRGYCFVAPVARGAHLQEGTALGADAEAPLPTNLPQYLTNIVGRDNELAELPAYLGRHRLVTLIGPGGIGKTRLANELGWQVLRDYPGGVRLVDLAPLSGHDAVVNATAAVLRVVLTDMSTAVDAIAAVLGRERQLLIFDNCEHLVDAVADPIRTLLGRAPGLSVLATSQEALKLPAEHLYRVAPLAVPPAGLVEIDGFGAVELFLDRVCASDDSFKLDQANATDIGEICRRLDGMPLALEMAAARQDLLGVRGLRAGLDDRLKMLRGRRRTGDARYDSLRAVVEWSYGLLEPHDQRVFRRLGVFPGSFTLDAAVTVAGGDSADRWEMVDALGRLVDKSLVIIEGHDPPRYRLLETLRLFAADGLRASGEGDVVAERHAQCAVETLGRAEAAWQTTQDPEWIQLYLPEVDNLRTALDWACAAPDRHPIALALGGPGIHLFDTLNLEPEARQWVERLVPLIDHDTPPAIEAGLLGQVWTVWLYNKQPQAFEHLERALQLFRGLDNRSGVVTALNYLAYIHALQWRFDEAVATFDEAWSLIAHSDQQRLRLRVLNCRMLTALKMGRVAEGRLYGTAALEIARTLKSVLEGPVLANLALVEYMAGDVTSAIDHNRVAVDCSRRSPGRRGLGTALSNQAAYLLADGNPCEARGFAEEALPSLLESSMGRCTYLQIYAVLLAFEGHVTEAAQLIGFVDAERSRTGALRQTTEDRLYEELGRRLRGGLPDDAIDALKEEGARWTQPDAIRLVTSWFPSHPGTATP